MRVVFEKECSKCKEIKLVAMFYTDKYQKSGLTCWCKECHRKSSASYRKNNPNKSKERIREWWLQTQYGLSPEEYDYLWDEQEGKCAICRGKCKTGRALAVDHCHKTGRVRGLLCKNCNSGIGFLCDTYTGVERALNYLKRSS